MDEHPQTTGFREQAVPAVINATGFGRHTFLVGQSGSGKTCSPGLLLEQLLLETDLRIVVFDPNADYVRIDTLADAFRTSAFLRRRIGCSA